MNDKFIKDMMIQNYQLDNYYDPTKIFCILSFIRENEIKKTCTIREISQYVYRYFISNIDIAKDNLNFVVRNISKYGIDDIIPHVVSTLKSWIREQINDSITMNGDYVSINLENYNVDYASTIKVVCKTLYQKYYKRILAPLVDYSDFSLIDDRNVDKFGQSKLKMLIFEDMQYCPLCEETNKEKLYAVHILFNDESDDISSSYDKNNFLLMCKDEATEYVNGRFYFDEFGRVINNGSIHVNNSMRISQKLLTKTRKYYLKSHSYVMEKRKQL